MTDIPEEFQSTLDGHTVDSRKLDLFFNGSDGSRVSDEQWDESKARSEADPESVDLGSLGFDYVGTDLPEGDVFATYEEGEDGYLESVND